MNALTSIRQVVPAIGPAAMPPAPGLIPAADMEKLNGITGLAGTSGAHNASSFSGVLDKVVSEVNQKQFAASQAVHDLQSGQSGSLHQTMIAMEEASVSFQLMVEVRNKVLESYQELMRMQI